MPFAYLKTATFFFGQQGHPILLMEINGLSGPVEFKNHDDVSPFYS